MMMGSADLKQSGVTWYDSIRNLNGSRKELLPANSLGPQKTPIRRAFGNIVC